MNSKSVLVTGASSGIGWACTKLLSGHGVHVFATVRKASDAQKLADTFGASVTPVLLDVTNEAAIFETVAQVEEQLGNTRLWGLVNNAGIAVEGPLLHLSAEQLKQQFEVNLVAVHNLVRAYAPLLGTDENREGNKGRIVNVSSVSGKTGMPFVGAYVASKHALEGYSESLRRELILYGIDVIVVAPGSVKTPIWDKSEAKGLTGFEDTDYADALRTFKRVMLSDGRKGLEPSVIANSVWKALSLDKPRVRYSPIPEKLKNSIIPNLLPKRMLDRLVAKTVGFKKP